MLSSAFHTLLHSQFSELGQPVTGLYQGEVQGCLSNGVAAEQEESLLPSWDFPGRPESELSPRVRLPCVVPRWVPQKHHSVPPCCSTSKVTCLLLSPRCLFLPDFNHGTGFSADMKPYLLVGQGPSTHPLTLLTGEGLTVYCHSQEKYILERTLNLMIQGGNQHQWYSSGRQSSSPRLT